MFYRLNFNTAKVSYGIKCVLTSVSLKSFDLVLLFHLIGFWYIYYSYELNGSVTADVCLQSIQTVIWSEPIYKWTRIIQHANIIAYTLKSVNETDFIYSNIVCTEKFRNLSRTRVHIVCVYDVIVTAADILEMHMLSMFVCMCVWMRFQHAHNTIWLLVRFSCYKLNMSSFYTFSLTTFKFCICLLVLLYLFCFFSSLLYFRMYLVVFPVRCLFYLIGCPCKCALVNKQDSMNVVKIITTV